MVRTHVFLLIVKIEQSVLIIKVEVIDSFSSWIRKISNPLTHIAFIRELNQ